MDNNKGVREVGRAAVVGRGGGMGGGQRQKTVLEEQLKIIKKIKAHKY